MRLRWAIADMGGLRIIRRSLLMVFKNYKLFLGFTTSEVLQKVALGTVTRQTYFNCFRDYWQL
jgi:hypothetical protein